MSFLSRFFSIYCGLFIGGSAILGSGCVSAYHRSVGGDLESVESQVFFTDHDTAWQAALESLKSVRIDVSNKESGHIQTKWTDNTNDQNFVDSFSGTGGKLYLKAQYRFRVDLTNSFYNGERATKIAVQKEQMVQNDVLEGWRPVESSLLDEKTLLYRIGRIIYIKIKLAQIEQARHEQEVRRAQEAQGGSGDTAVDGELDSP